MTELTREQAEHEIAIRVRELKRYVEETASAVMDGTQAAMVIMRELGVGSPPPFLAQAAARHVTKNRSSLP